LYDGVSVYRKGLKIQIMWRRVGYSLAMRSRVSPIATFGNSSSVGLDTGGVLRVGEGMEMTTETWAVRDISEDELTESPPGWSSSGGRCRGRASGWAKRPVRKAEDLSCRRSCSGRGTDGEGEGSLGLFVSCGTYITASGCRVETIRIRTVKEGEAGDATHLDGRQVVCRILLLFVQLYPGIPKLRLRSKVPPS